MNKKNIVFIGGGNGQSNILKGVKDFFEDFKITSIVSMSDDGRTTGLLMNLYYSRYSFHLPPPGDLRRCLFALSNSIYKDKFALYLETEIKIDKNISETSIKELFEIVSENDLDFMNFLNQKLKDILDFKIDINSTIKGHKLGNLIMAIIYHNFGDYNKMIKYIQNILESVGDILPITTSRAYIQAKLVDGTVIQKQDNISNVADYNSPIQSLELMDCSKEAIINIYVINAIENADYIVIGPGDIYTSIVSNLIIGNIRDILRNSKAKIIYISNNTNKGGETNGLRTLDFINIIERYISKKLDYVILNNYLPNLNEKDTNKLKIDISVKGGEYVFLDEYDKYLIKSKNTIIIEDDLIDRETLYKHNNKKIANILKNIITI